MRFTHVAPLAALGFQLTSAQSYLNGQLSEVLSEKSVRFSECNTFIQTCHPQVSSCASWICQECQGLGQSKLEACCATDSAPTACLATALLKNPGAVPATTTTDSGEQSPATETAGGHSAVTSPDTTVAATMAASQVTTGAATVAASSSGSAATKSASSADAGPVLKAGVGLAGIVLGLAVCL